MIGKEAAKRTRRAIDDAIEERQHALTGVVVSVGTNVATLTINGSPVEIPDVPYLEHVDGTLTADDIVQLDWIGDSPLIIGRY